MKKLKASVVALLSVALLSACGNLPNPLGKSQDDRADIHRYRRCRRRKGVGRRQSF